MSNEVINPYETFRDDQGKVLAGGGLRIQVNGTTTLGTAFSDSALQNSQTVDPYRLDNFGRVRGNLRWAGLRTVVVLNDRDTEIRTLNDVVTIVDTTGFAINFASVAAMVADTTLEVGDVAETQSYNASQGEGGARYLIVGAATGTDDGYTFHDLDNSLQAQLLDLEKNNNFYVAGAIGNGTTDDSLPLQAVFDIGGDIRCENGVFKAESLTLTTDARIAGDGTIIAVSFSTTDTLSLSGNDLTISFDGITMDGDSDNHASESAIASISSAVLATSGNQSVVTFNNVTFQNGNMHDVLGDGADDGNSVLYSFAQCRFLGGLEATATPYLPSYGLFSDGVDVLVEDCYFDLQADPAVIGGRGGIVALGNAADLTNPGYLSVADCTFNRIGASADASNVYGAVHARQVRTFIAHGNRILTPQYAGIAFGAEVDTLDINNNLIDSLTGTHFAGGIAGLVTTDAAPGDNWQIEGNILTSILLGNGIVITGASAGIDASNLVITDNLIDSPVLAAISVHNIEGLELRDNYIDMASLGVINAIEIATDGVSGDVGISGNTIINVGGAAIINGVTSTAVFRVDGNTIESVVDGITIEDSTDAFITNNSLVDVSGDLITVGTLTDCILDGNSYTGGAPTTFAQNSGSITNLTTGENFWDEIDTSILDLTGAAIPITSHYHELTDTTTITSATFTGDVIGFLVVLLATVSVQVNDSATIVLVGGANYSMTASDTLTLAWDGAAFNEVSRSVN
jgi:hypothetical protein